MTEAQRSDAMKNLVLFIMGLAVLGTIVALVLYFAVDLPAMQAAALHAPSNMVGSSAGHVVGKSMEGK